MVELHLNYKVVTAQRLTLRSWLEFERIQKAIQQAVADHMVDEYERQIHCLIATACAIPVEDLDGLPWFEAVTAMALLNQLNRIHDLPLLRHPEKDSDVPWDYPERSWYWWLHLFAKHYGWEKSQVEALDIDEALALLQEILVEEQLEREWEWSLSEVAYPYNPTTKKAPYKPLPRPAWMTGKAKIIAGTVVKFRKSMLPVGAIVGEDGHERIVH